MATKDKKTKVTKPVEPVEPESPTKEKDTKEKVKAGSEKTKSEKNNDTINKETSKANLNLNINSFRKWMIRQYETADLEKPNFSGGQVALTAANEAMCNYVIKETLSHVTKDKTGLHCLSTSGIAYAIQNNKDLRFLFNNYLDIYESEIDHSGSYCVSKHDVNKFVTKFHGDNVSLNGSGFNLLAFLLSRFSALLCRTAYKFMVSSKKKSINKVCVRTATEIHCTDALANIICQKIDDAMTNWAEKDDDEEVKEAKEDVKDDKDTKKNKKDTKEKDTKEKDTKKSKPQVLNDLFVQDVSDDDSDNDENDEKAKKSKKNAKLKDDSDDDKDNKDDNDDDSDEDVAPKSKSSKLKK